MYRKRSRKRPTRRVRAVLEFLAEHPVTRHHNRVVVIGRVAA